MHGNKGYSYIDSNKIHITKNFIFENLFFFQTMVLFNAR